MKKLFAGILAAAAIAAAGTTGVVAANGGFGKNYIDADNDGICDRAAVTCKFIDEDGDGVCDTKGEYCPNNGTRPQDGSGLRHGHCRGRRG